MSTNKIKAVYENELIKVLSNLNLYEKILKSEINCVNCGNKITLENLQYIIPSSEENKIIISCNNSKCITKVENTDYARK